MNVGRIPLPFRFPAYLLEEIREAATRHHLSLGGEKVTAVEEPVKNQQKRKQTREEACL
jgi:hypothetical protein